MNIGFIRGHLPYLIIVLALFVSCGKDKVSNIDSKRKQVFALIDKHALPDIVAEQVDYSLSLEQIEVVVNRIAARYKAERDFIERFNVLNDELNIAEASNDKVAYSLLEEKLNRLKEEALQKMPASLKFKLQAQQSKQAAQAEKYLKDLAKLSTKSDSIALAARYGFSLPIEQNGQTIINTISFNQYNLNQ